MNKDLGLSAYVFGWGAGIFFLGYFLFEVPSNVILEKTGARIWIVRNGTGDDRSEWSPGASSPARWR
jgi:hypothetical protein